MCFFRYPNTSKSFFQPTSQCLDIWWNTPSRVWYITWKIKLNLCCIHYLDDSRPELILTMPAMNGPIRAQSPYSRETTWWWNMISNNSAQNFFFWLRQRTYKASTVYGVYILHTVPNNHRQFVGQGLVIWKPINTNPPLKVNRCFHLACLKWFKRLISS